MNLDVMCITKSLLLSRLAVMTRHLLPFLLFSLVLASPHLFQNLGPQAVNLWRLDLQEQGTSRLELPLRKVITVQDGYRQSENDNREFGASKKLALSEFEPQWFEQPLDHFDKSNTHTFQQRYWVNKRHYQPRVGAPVIVLDGGETSGEVHLFYSAR